MTWEEAKINSDKLTDKIEEILSINKPKNVVDILNAVKEVDTETTAMPNYNSEGQYCQLLIYPSKKWHTWSSTSMSITKYNIYQ